MAVNLKQLVDEISMVDEDQDIWYSPSTEEFYEQDDDVPEDFWTTNAVYVAQASLFSIKWAEKFGQDEIDGMVRRARASMKNFDNFNKAVPKWYSNKMGKLNMDVC